MKKAGLGRGRRSLAIEISAILWKDLEIGWLLTVVPNLFNLYAEYIMRNAGLEETQAGIKIARRNINNLR